MKIKILNILCLLICMAAQAQLFTINWTVNGNLQDLLSQREYNEINRYNTLLGAQELGNLGSTRAFTSVINDQMNELITYNPLYKAEEVSLKRFVSNSSFNSRLGYNSYGYIKKKYPLNIINANDAFRNSVIQLRFKLKLEAESKRISDYLNLANPIPEGERVLLILNTLENVIKITLEDETY